MIGEMTIITFTIINRIIIYTRAYKLVMFQDDYCFFLFIIIYW